MSIAHLNVCLGLFALATLATAPSCTTETLDRVATGAWGGQHIGMVVSDSGATIEYDCATGRITEALLLDANGNFQWSGVHVPGHGGPIRQGEVFDSLPARYAGSATKDRMTLTLTITGSTQPAQTFTLARGGTASVFRCL